MSYIKNVLIAFDKLGNALAMGSPDVTVSARIGYHASNQSSFRYWTTLQYIVDWAFEPIDGEGHCVQSIEECELSLDTGGLGLFLVSILVFIFAPPIGVFTHLFVPVVNHARGMGRAIKEMVLK